MFLLRFMRLSQAINFTIFFLLSHNSASWGQNIMNNDYLISFHDTIKDEYGYRSGTGDTIIPLGKYEFCFTDTFRTFAIVSKSSFGVVVIDRNENILYEVFPFENGPDYSSDGFFRIIVDNKIGFANSATGKILINPRFGCAFPFENGLARVCNNCTTQSDGEHSTWFSDYWYYIDKTGKKVDKTKTIK